jgi:acetyl-CoA synthetase
MADTSTVRRDPPPLADYAKARADFRWENVATVLGGVPDSVNLGALATERHVAQGRGDEHAIVWLSGQGQTERLSYRDLTEASARAANALVAAGVRRGDRVVFLLPIVPELFTGVLGALRAGAIVCVVGPARNLEYFRNTLGRARPRLIVTSPAFRNSVAVLREESPDLQGVFFVNRTGMKIGDLGEGERDWSSALEGAPSSFATVMTAPSDRALLYYTELGMSGSVIAHQAALPLFESAGTVLEMRAGEATVSIGMPGEAMFVPYVILAPLLVGTTLVAIEDPAHFMRFADIAADHDARVWYSSFIPSSTGLKLECRGTRRAREINGLRVVRHRSHVIRIA